ncbi:hypothetical protein GCM10009535_12260 [Streptomyces thermocarboxydovorans]|uniref:Uncharacterized protein n=1 Tax=Streptomyces thermocarboxydovorans TaxID=59298 RepID=A0ABP3SG56_9ACTN
MSTPTAPLPPAALAAVRSLELRLAVPADVARAVSVQEAASARAARLSDLAAAGRMSDLDADSLAHAEDLIAGARATLAKAGRLDLIGGA